MGAEQAQLPEISQEEDEFQKAIKESEKAARAAVHAQAAVQRQEDHEFQKALKESALAAGVALPGSRKFFSINTRDFARVPDSLPINKNVRAGVLAIPRVEASNSMSTDIIGDKQK